MDIKLLTPVQIFVNGKFLCTADTVEIKRNSPEFKKSLLPDNPKTDPDNVTGTVVNIVRNKRTKEEIKASQEERKKNTYDEFYNRMNDAIDDPNAHIPVDTSDI
jgi:hypothetical protein